MKTVPISEFKAKCIGILKNVQLESTPLIVTLRGKPLVRVEPIGVEGSTKRLGALRGQMTIKGDIVHSHWDEDWENGL